MIITIDGPSGSGKSSIAQVVAQKLGYYYLNSGFLYRGLAFALLRAYGYTLQTVKDASQDDVQKALGDMTYVYDEQGAHIWYCDKEITDHLKEVEVTKASSLIAKLLHVREAIIPYQKNLAKKHDIIAEGRDMGSIVFPEAEHKFYVTADLPVRAERMRKDLLAKGEHVSEVDMVVMVQVRDMQDSTRTHGPLVQPAGAIHIDTTHGTVQEYAQYIINRIE